MDNPTIQDLVSLAYDQKPIEFQDTFNSLVADRIAKAIDDKKVEVAQNMFAARSEEEVEDTEINSEEDLETEEPTDGETA